MSIRKCIYTNKDAKSKDSIIPKDYLNSELHNWSVSAPANSDYLSYKKDRLPNELEMQANELFHLLELSRLRVKYYEEKLKEIQSEILKDYKEPLKDQDKPSKADKIKEKQIQQAIAQKTIQESSNKIEELLKNKRKNLFEDELDENSND